MRKLTVEKPIQDADGKKKVGIMSELAVLMSREHKKITSDYMNEKIKIRDGYKNGVLVFEIRYTKPYKISALILQGCLIDVLKKY